MNDTPDAPAPADEPPNPPLEPAAFKLPNWREDAAKALRYMADELEAGRATSVCAVVMLPTRSFHYRGCTDMFTGALLVTRALDVVDELRRLINGRDPTLAAAQMLQHLVDTPQGGNAGGGDGPEPTQGGAGG